MIRSALAALMLVVPSAGAVSAQDWAEKMFETTRHEFGSVARGAKVEFFFTVKNIYVEDVHIASVRSSCGCTTPEITKDTLKTYEEGAVKATFNTRAFLGHKHATLTVTIDKPFYAQVQLYVDGYIRSDVVLNPPGVELGSVEEGVAVTKKIEISYAGRSDWQILGVKSSNPCLQVKVVETARGDGRVSYELEVRMTEDAPAGYIKEQLTLQTNDHRSTEFPVDVEGRVLSQLTLSPSSLFLGVLQPGQKVTKRLVIQAKKPFRIVGIRCDDSCFEFETPDTSKQVHLVPVTFTAGNQAGKVTCNIRIETDLGTGAASELTAYAQVLAPVQTSGL